MNLCDFYCLIIKNLYSMERNFITINALKKILSAKEMKNITGGSAAWCHCLNGNVYDVESCSLATCEGECGIGKVQNCNYVNG